MNTNWNKFARGGGVEETKPECYTKKRNDGSNYTTCLEGQKKEKPKKKKLVIKPKPPPAPKKKKLVIKPKPPPAPKKKKIVIEEKPKSLAEEKEERIISAKKDVVNSEKRLSNLKSWTDAEFAQNQFRTPGNYGYTSWKINNYTKKAELVDGGSMSKKQIKLARLRTIKDSEGTLKRDKDILKKLIDKK